MDFELDIAVDLAEDEASDIKTALSEQAESEVKYAAVDHNTVLDQQIAEEEAVDSYASDLATLAAEVDSVSKSDLTDQCSAIADASNHYRRDELRETVEEAVGDVGRNGSHIGPPLDQLLRNSVETIHLMRTTDVGIDPEYRWVLKVETPERGVVECSFKSGADGITHFKAELIRKKIASDIEYTPDVPEDVSMDGTEWNTFILGIINDPDNLNKVEVTGPRTTVVQDLQSEITHSPGFTTLDGAFDSGGVALYGVEADDVAPEVDGDGDDALAQADIESVMDEADSIYVPYDVIGRLVEDRPITERALQAELDARGYTPSGASSASRRVKRGERRYKVWELDTSIATPSHFAGRESNPAAERAREEDARQDVYPAEDDDELWGEQHAADDDQRGSGE